MAKHELTSGPLPPKGAKLRLAALPAPPDGGAAAEGPGLHEGFYDFARSVVRPQPSARQYAQQLESELKEKLRSLRGAGPEGVAAGHGGEGGDGEREANETPGTFLTDAAGAEEASGEGEPVDAALLEEAEAARSQVSLSLGTLEQYATDTTTDSKERAALLGTVKRATAFALERLVGLVRSRTREAQRAAKAKTECETSLHHVEEDNTGLRHVVQQMLATEATLQSKHTEAQREVADLERSLDEAQHKIDQLTSQLGKVTEELHDLRDESSKRRAVRDACHSPMMGFSNFLLGADQVPPPANVELGRSAADGAPSAAISLSGFEQQERGGLSDSYSQARRLGSSLASADEPPSQRCSTRPSIFPESTPMRLMQPALGRATTARLSVLGGGAEVRASIFSGNKEPPPGLLAPAAASAPRLSQASRSSPPSPAPDPAEVLRVPNMGRALSRGTEGDISEVEEEDFPALQPSPLATSFPALIPFLDFSGLETPHQPHVHGPHGHGPHGHGPHGHGPHGHGGHAGGKADAAHHHHSHHTNPNQEHLEKHLVMMQEEYQQELQRAEALQHSVDVSLERVLVWVQAVHDSLHDLNSESVKQDVRALGAVRDAVVWLAKHPCKEWTNPRDRLDKKLDEYEGVVRSQLSQERPADSEMEGLRAALVASKQRVEELSEQLLEARSSGGGGGGNVGQRTPIRQRITSWGSAGAPVSPSRRASQGLLGHGINGSDVAVQCDLGGMATIGEEPRAGLGPGPKSGTSAAGPSSSGEQQGGGCSSSSGQRSAAQRPSGGLGGDARGGPMPPEAPARVTMVPPEVAGATPPDNLGDAGSARGGGIGAADEGEDEGLVTQPSVASSGAPSAHSDTEREAQRLRLLRSKFVEGIDLTLVPLSDRVLLRPPLADGSSPAPGAQAPAGDKLFLSLKQLHAFISQVYAEKKTDDAKRDKVGQPRRELCVVLQELMRRQHGVRKVVHQKSWQLVESIAHHAVEDRMANTFADFLDSSRDLGELSFYLYCSKVLTTVAAEESQAFPPSRPTAGWVAAERAFKLVELLFGDLPKALGVIRMEVEKAARVFALEQRSLGLGFGFGDFETFSSVDSAEPRVAVADLLVILLEGWRMSAGLLEQSVAGFSWSSCVLAFLQTDITCRGWLDPHEVRDAEAQRLSRVAGSSGEGDPLRLHDQTSLGAFVFREFNRCSNAQVAGHGGSGAPEPGGAITTLAVSGAEKKRPGASACLRVSQAMFESLEKTLGTYLTWLMHSDALGDLAVYHTVKSRMFGFRKAMGSSDAGEGAHHFRCLLLLLLAHQFDAQLQKGGVAADYLEWELTCLLQVLRESWRRSAAQDPEDATPDFGAELGDAGGGGALTAGGG